MPLGGVCSPAMGYRTGSGRCAVPSDSRSRSSSARRASFSMGSRIFWALENSSLRSAMRRFSSRNASCQRFCVSRLLRSRSPVNRMVSVKPVTCTISRRLSSFITWNTMLR